ncbi:hypothetical protein ACWEK2_03995 [Streptomyces albidoflavus]
MKCNEPMPGGIYKDCDRKLLHEGAHSYLGQTWPGLEQEVAELTRQRDRIANDVVAALPSRADVLRKAAALVARFTGNDLDANAKMLRRAADEVETETHIVADDSADPEHVGDCPGCRPRRAATETDPDRELLRRASDDSSDWDDATWAAWWRIAERAHARSTTCTCGTPGGDS